MSKSEWITKLAGNLAIDAEQLSAYQSLSEQQLQKLYEGISSAQSQQRETLQKAIQLALSHVPKLVRKPIIKILGLGAK